MRNIGNDLPSQQKRPCGGEPNGQLTRRRSRQALVSQVTGQNVPDGSAFIGPTRSGPPNLCEKFEKLPRCLAFRRTPALRNAAAIPVAQPFQFCVIRHAGQRFKALPLSI